MTGLVLPCLTLASAPARAGALNPAAGQGVVIFATTFTSGGDYVDGRGRRWRTPSYSKFETQAHAEVGLTDWLAVVARPRYARVRTTIRRRAFGWEGVGASEFGVQARLLRFGSWALAAQALGRTPASPATDWEDRGGVEARLMLGGSFSLFGLPAYVETQFGLRTRGGRPSEWVGEDTFALRVMPRLLLLAQGFVTHTIESARRRIARGAPIGSLHAKLQLGLVYDLAANWSLGAAVFRTIVARDAALETGATLSLWRRF
jgi:hypothetical protein